MVRDIRPASASSGLSNFVAVGGILFFTANDGSSGMELWKSDGTAAGTVIVRDINPLGSASPQFLTAVGGTLFFFASDGVSGTELWKSDGTTAGTVQVKDINPGASGSIWGSVNVVMAGGVLYFPATDGTNGTELWRSDGTPTGTMMVTEVNPGAAGSNPSHLAADGSTVYFSAENGTTGAELWRSDGTAAGTVLVKDIRPGIDGSLPDPVQRLGGFLYFAADNGEVGRELWRTDGTEAGTTLVKDIRPGVDGSSPVLPRTLNDNLYFWANDGTSGVELWNSDGFEAGTTLLADINPGADGSTPNAPTRSGDRFFVAANDPLHNIELWKIQDGADVNEPPHSAADTYAVNNNTTLDASDETGTETSTDANDDGVLANDDDPDGDPRTAVLVSGPFHGTLNLDSDGSFVYTPAAGYHGPDSFTYRASAAMADGNVTTVSIDVLQVITYSAGAYPFESIDVVPGAPGVTTILDGVDDGAATVSLGANRFKFFGSTFSSLFVSSNGLITFNSSNTEFLNSNLLSTPIQRSIAPLWDDWLTERTPADQVLFRMENDRLIIEWNQVPHRVSSTTHTLPVTFQAILQLNTAGPGDIIFNYVDVNTGNPSFDNGLSATVGIKFSAFAVSGGVQVPNRLLVSFNSLNALIGDSKAIRLAALNNAPVANADTYASAEDTPLAANVLANDSDGDADTLVASLVNGPTHGALSFNADGAFTYAPDANYFGPDSFTYRASDGQADSNVATVSIDVTPVNDAPVLGAIGARTVNEGSPLIFTASATDPDLPNNTLTFSLDSGAPAGASIDPVTGAFTWTPRDNGTFLVTVRVRDDGSASLDDFETIQITSHNVAPSAQIVGTPAIKVLPGDAVNLSALVTDPGANDTHTFAWSVTKNGNPFASGTDANLTFTPDGIGIYAVSLVATDDDGAPSAAATASVEAISSSISGLVWLDINNTGQVDLGEDGIGGVRVNLAGTDDLGHAVSRTLLTDADGVYVFANLHPGIYSLSQVQPGGYVDGRESLGTSGGSVGADAFGGIVLGENRDGQNYNFGERPPGGGTVSPGMTATIGFWQNRNGQELIKRLNGGPTATQLSAWLAATMPNVYGAAAGAQSSVVGMTNAQVAALYQTKFRLQGPKVDAQVMAAALAVYVTTSSLGGGAGASYGFIVSAGGLGNVEYSVGTHGVAFGVANGTSLRVIDILLAVNEQAVGGLLYGGDAALRTHANAVFDDINNDGDI